MKPQKQPGIKSILVLVVSSVLVAECVKTEDVINPESLKIWEIYNVGNGIGSDSIMSLAEDKEGGIWVGTRNNGVSKFDGIKWSVYNVASGLVDNEVFCIAQDGSGNMWFGTAGGLSILSNNSWTNIPEFGPISALMKDHDNKMWMASSYYGVLIFDNNTLYQYYDDECELCNAVNVLYEDNEQNIWIGSWMDLKKLSGQQVISYTRNNGLPGNTVTAIHQDIWGNIWVGIQFSSYVTRLSNGNLDQVDLSNGLSINFVTSISSDNYGNVWFGLLSKGAHKYNGSMMKPYTVKDGLPHRTITSIIKDRHGYLWFGTLSGGVVRYLPGMD